MSIKKKKKLYGGENLGEYAYLSLKISIVVIIYLFGDLDMSKKTRDLSALHTPDSRGTCFCMDYTTYKSIAIL